MSPRARRPDTRAALQRPLTSGNFLVDLGMGDPRAPEAGFCEVVFPEFMLAHPEAGPTADRVAGPALAAPTPAYLVLRRAATGALDLYQWWVLARDARKPPPRRTVTVELLAADMTVTVMRWRFLKASPVSLAYSPLNAQVPGLLYETLSLAFDRVEMG
ncbi:phage tail protein [Variovorax sp. J22G21]|uniref:phage tail protein n=1 Tax=Variovorax fucosicus TaxID=3053517 RepID=UPI00257771C5|nr:MULTISPECIES: phage tail protein [unclassified Variovorax]MDM0042485.1 phage tail protein [Variovorax sp. J22R193]MDM0061090.1 phage tail protein [Variovorax sp. J22G21]